MKALSFFVTNTSIHLVHTDCIVQIPCSAEIPPLAILILYQPIYCYNELGINTIMASRKWVVFRMSS